VRASNNIRKADIELKEKENSEVKMVYCYSKIKEWARIGRDQKRMARTG
jgi:hypothetical protein